MARTPDTFGSGTISTSNTVLVGPVPPNEIWYVTQLSGRNTGAADVDVEFFVRVDGVLRALSGGTIDSDGGSYDLVEKSIILGPGNSIVATASVADVLTYYATGIREDA